MTTKLHNSWKDDMNGEDLECRDGETDEETSKWIKAGNKWLKHFPGKCTTEGSTINTHRDTQTHSTHKGRCQMLQAGKSDPGVQNGVTVWMHRATTGME